MRSQRIAVLVPCYNEAISVGDVVRSFSAALPGADIYVYDNNSTDTTTNEAVAAGAQLRREELQGKGNVVRRMFSDVDADIYVLVDGDGTYDPGSAAPMIDLLTRNKLDMVVGKRVTAGNDRAVYRPGHELGNKIMTCFVAWLFGERFTDIFSGYRVFSRRFVKSFPALARGFEIETELTVYALQLGLPVAEVPSMYSARPAGSASKLSTFRDGWRILLMILELYKDARPFRFFAAIGAVLMLLALVLAWPLMVTWLETGLVPRFPTAILATGIALAAFLSLACGLILDSVARGRLEAKRLFYLQQPPIDQNGATRESSRATSNE